MWFSNIHVIEIFIHYDFTLVVRQNIMQNFVVELWTYSKLPECYTSIVHYYIAYDRRSIFYDILQQL